MKWLLAPITLLWAVSLWAQKKQLDVCDFNNWKSIDQFAISDNGAWVSYLQSPFKGDGSLFVVSCDGQQRYEFERASKAIFIHNGDFIAYQIAPKTDSIRSHKIKKTKAENMPIDSLGIWNSSTHDIRYFKKLHQVLASTEGSYWLAISQKPTRIVADTTQQKTKKRSKNDTETFLLTLYNAQTKAEHTFENVTEVCMAESGLGFAFVQLATDSTATQSLYVFDTHTEKTTEIATSSGAFAKPAMDFDGSQLAYLQSADTAKTKNYDLWHWSHKQDSRKLTHTILLPPNTHASIHQNLWFSRNAKHLYFGTAPTVIAEPKDTLLESEKVKLDIWSWTDARIQPQQLAEFKKDEKQSYLAVALLPEGKIVQLADDTLPEIQTFDQGNAQFALGFDETPYLRSQSWDSDAGRNLYYIDLHTGARKYGKRVTDFAGISPQGNYIYWFEPKDSCWYTSSIRTEIPIRHKIPTIVYDETQNTPEQADPYGTAGWTTHDKYLWIYDRYDLWQIDPTGKEAAIKITSGREHNLQYRYLKLDPKALHIDPTKPIRYSIFNLHTKDAHFGISHKGKMRQTPAQAFSYSRPIKAKKTDTLIWTRENFSTFPNLWISDTEIANPLCLSDANPQQTQYNWGTAEIFRWEIEPGQQEEGILYKPENFDPNKKYPTLVYFYELNSDQIHQYHNPKPSRSVINRTVFVSNEYLVFVPNIRYKTGYPGESALKYVLSGSRALSQASYVDSTRIGIQGQSWGGYQVAYIICRTPFFRAAWAGAAVSNMTSAYGGIRWATGVSRMFQYEKTQSRIGATLWEKPELYIANSPLFMAPDIQTPLAMMHNDNDGAVPWAQSIELFLALRRLNKPVWLLNYNGEPHNLNANSPNGVDLSIRLKQYFDHYLKDQPAPIWMTHGIPALDKGKKFGYETTQ